MTVFPNLLIAVGVLFIRGVERRVMAVAAAPLAVILLAPSLLAWFGPKSIPWSERSQLSLERHQVGGDRGG